MSRIGTALRRPRHATPLVAALALHALALPSCGQFDPAPDLDQLDAFDAERVAVELVWREAPAAGAAAVLGVILDIQEKWHVQAGAGSGDELEGYIATTIDLTLPEGWTAGAVSWPEAHTFVLAFGDIQETLVGYEGRTLAAVPVTVPAGAAAGEYAIAVEVGYQACDDRACEMPASAKGGATVTLGPSAPPGPALDEETAGLFAAALEGGGSRSGRAGPGAALDAATIGGFVLVLLLAAAGGLLLNFTPCVLPVIPIKIMGLARSAGHAGRTMRLGVALALGVIGFWMALGVAVATVSGMSTNQLFQWPWFPISVGVIIAVMAVGMCGLFTMRLPNWVYAINPSHDTYHGSFLFGIMAAVLSTPCTAPFMGTAIAGSIGQPVPLVLSVFAAIGVGMAVPYMVLSAKPSLVAKMPRSGPAGELIKQVMGLLMLAVAAYFLGVGLSGIFQQPGEAASKVYWWFAGLFTVAAGLWLAYRTFRITSRPGRRVIFGGLGVAQVVGGVLLGVIMTDKGPISWMYYTPERLEAELDRGQVVVLKFTAEWCVNCHFLERTVINTDAVIEVLGRDGVTPMKVDLTSGETASKTLHQQYWRSIPYLVVQRPDGSVAFKADWYVPDQVVRGVEDALRPQVARKKAEY